jgi:DNA-binding MarR family transcriptional regulator
MTGRHTAEGASFTELVLTVFRLHGRLMAAGSELCRGLDLTTSRWQVLGAIAMHEGPPTVADIGRVMGMTRQGVQRVVDDLERAGLVRRVSNPAHKRARPVAMTESGLAAYRAITSRQVPWANQCARGLGAAPLQRLVRGLKQVEQNVPLHEGND